MLRSASAAVLALALVPAAHAAVDCSVNTSASPLPLPATTIAPVADELYIRGNQLGMPAGVLSSNYDPSQSLDQVLQRLRIDGCQNIAKAIPSAPAVKPNDPAAYKPQTEFDNTPWRFDMSQNGKRMTAEEFDAWMKARGCAWSRRARPRPPLRLRPKHRLRPSRSTRSKRRGEQRLAHAPPPPRRPLPRTARAAPNVSSGARHGLARVLSKPACARAARPRAGSPKAGCACPAASCVIPSSRSDSLRRRSRSMASRWLRRSACT